MPASRPAEKKGWLYKIYEEGVKSGDNLATRPKMNKLLAEVERGLYDGVLVVIGIDLDGNKDVLGMWIGENESSKFWLSVLNDLKNRGVQDILITCVDNLTGFSQAISACYPLTEIQKCVIHQIRNSTLIS